MLSFHGNTTSLKICSSLPHYITTFNGRSDYDIAKMHVMHRSPPFMCWDREGEEIPRLHRPGMAHPRTARCVITTSPEHVRAPGLRAVAAFLAAPPIPAANLPLRHTTTGTCPRKPVRRHFCVRVTTHTHYRSDLGRQQYKFPGRASNVLMQHGQVVSWYDRTASAQA